MTWLEEGNDPSRQVAFSFSADVLQERYKCRRTKFSLQLCKDDCCGYFLENRATPGLEAVAMAPNGVVTAAHVAKEVQNIAYRKQNLNHASQCASARVYTSAFQV